MFQPSEKTVLAPGTICFHSIALTSSSQMVQFRSSSFFFLFLYSQGFCSYFLPFFSNCVAFRMSQPQTVTTAFQSCCDNHQILEEMEENQRLRLKRCTELMEDGFTHYFRMRQSRLKWTPLTEIWNRNQRGILPERVTLKSKGHLRSECTVQINGVQDKQGRQQTTLLVSFLHCFSKGDFRLTTISRPELKGSWQILSVSECFTVFSSLCFGKEGLLYLQRETEQKASTRTYIKIT